MSTLTIPHVVPSPQEDCEKLHTAFSGWGTNEGAIIEVVAHRTAAQRNAIRRAYHDLHGEDILKSFDKELTRDFEKAVLLWMLDPVERDATLVHEAVKKWAPHDRVLVEIAVIRTANELLAIRRAYQEKYKKSLEEDVATHTTGDFRKLMVPLVSSYRYEGPEVDHGLAKSEAHILHEKIKDEEYNNEEVIRILTTRSKAQLMATFNAYHEQHGNPINKDLKKDPKDDFLFALRSIIRSIACPERYLEKVIRISMKQTGTDENALTRVVITHAEVNLKAIKEVYYKRNTVKLEDAIKRDTKGDYEDFLLALIGSDEA